MKTLNLHIESTKTVGISLWIGKYMPELERQCIENNAKYFDAFFLLTNIPRKGFSNGVCQIIDPEMLNIIYSAVPEQLMNSDFPDKAPNYASDILTYFPFQVLEKFVTTTADLPKAIMYVDTDYYIYSKFMVKELFSMITYQGGMMFLKDNNYYLKYHNPEYVNSCWSLSTDTDLKIKINSFLDYFMNPTYDRTKYSCIGPRYTNTDYWRKYAEVAPLVPHTFDPRYCYLGLNEESIVKGALGIHLAKSLPKEIGYNIVSISRNTNKLYIRIT